ncbi:MAG: hypothetical protein ACRDHD_10300, partial [Candidatus Limnocylindria bacterium]
MIRSGRRLPGAVLGGALAAALPGLAAAHGEEAPRPELPGVLLAWPLDPVPLVAVAVAAAVYLWAVRRVTAAHPATPPRRWRGVAFLAGLGAILLALGSPVEA